VDINERDRDRRQAGAAASCLMYLNTFWRRAKGRSFVMYMPVSEKGAKGTLYKIIYNPVINMSSYSLEEVPICVELVFR
jgi:hypothetical protein